MALYLTECADQLADWGELTFAARYATPVLVVRSFAGKLREGRAAAGGTMVSERPNDLVATGSQLIGRVFLVKKATHTPPGPVTLGRTGDNDIAIPEYSISKRHCWFRLDGARWVLLDLGSTNGTLLDGLPIAAKRPMPLQDGATLTFGRFDFGFHTSAGFMALIKRA